MVFNISLYTYYFVITQLETKEMYPSLSSILAETSGLSLIYRMTSTPIGTNTKHGLISAVNKLISRALGGMQFETRKRKKRKAKPSVPWALARAGSKSGLRFACRGPELDVFKAFLAGFPCHLLSFQC